MMISDPATYRKILLEKAFANEQAMLLRKQLHELYSEPSINITEWVANRYHWQGNERVLDIGCGPGTYLDTMQDNISLSNYFAGDLSTGMLKAFKGKPNAAQVGIFNTEAESLPFPDESFDVVLANHMLHHVVDIDRTLSEIRRVLRRPNGVLIASTNSEFTMPEFNTLMQRAVRLLRHSARQDVNDMMLEGNFSLERGSVLLSRHFKSVVRHDLLSDFVFRETKPVVDYIESARPFYEPMLPEGIRWDDFMMVMEDQVRRLVDHFSELVVHKHLGVLIATDEGGFAQSYWGTFNTQAT